MRLFPTPFLSLSSLSSFVCSFLRIRAVRLRHGGPASLGACTSFFLTTPDGVAWRRVGWGETRAEPKPGGEGRTEPKGVNAVLRAKNQRMSTEWGMGDNQETQNRTEQSRAGSDKRR
ncbi:hypothetical protein CALCODRAFT_35735 [Calocera cornea HHB12733]|uniref:Uncharacterized protein n=1 Tax=Calocera cornea HHB12733 TaxID=1353952 RepID=A0A165E0Q6_9BASI|nr:hypothetical protein CALCODRAFT_35735 [Calocera cornea HHB12733]